MEPNKFDNIFKEKLEQRAIQPREIAWDRLDAMLSVAEEKAAKPKKKSRVWMYMAASFLGLLLVGTIFLKQGDSNKNTQVESTDVQVAVTPEPAMQPNSNPTETGFTAQDVIEAEVAVAAATVSKPAKKPSVIKSGITKAEAATSSPIIVQEAVAQVNKAEVADQPASNEAETLLADANTGQAKKPAIKVNASSLLSSVEGELDNSFRAKAMQTLVKNYNSVKTSVANRNHK